jgi:lipoyl synthase
MITEKKPMTNTNQLRRPDWIKIRLKTSENFLQTKTLLENQGLNTVCEEARCPNIYECWERKTATVMILGDICTRACRFCSVKTGRPGVVDEDEPLRTAEAVKHMGLTHVVITSVDRDDLKNDYGSRIWAQTIQKIHEIVDNCTVEVLTPDFKGYKPALDNIFAAGPEIFSHNVECVPRVSKKVRSQANWEVSKSVLKYSIFNNMNTKTGMMVGLGETDEEVLDVMKEMAELGVSIFNIGQYLQPSLSHIKVNRYVHPDTFAMFKEEGLKMGFKVVESAPLVRSSYHADEQVNNYMMLKGNT